MITIITGKINGGKSNTILKHYIDHQQGDGFVSNKRMHYNKVHSYQLVHLKEQRPMTFVITEKDRKQDQKIACSIGPYLFLQDTLDYVEKTVKELVKNKVEPIYFDEIGQLELNNECFHSALNYVIEHNLDCVITVRETFIDQVLKKYQITKYKIIKVS